MISSRSRFVSTLLTLAKNSTIWVAVIGLAIFAAPQLSLAKTTKYSRKSTLKKIKVRQTKRTKKRITSRGKGSEVKPDLSADEFITVQGKVRHLRKEQIRLYAQLIRDTDSSNPQLPDYLFRLADAYAQQQRYWRFRVGEMYAKIDDSKGKKAKSKLKKEQAKYAKREKRYMLQAIKVYKSLTSNQHYRNYPNMDQALFYYAFTLQGAKYIDQARVVYRTLIQNYPKSKYIPEAFLSFADYFFVNSQLANAEKFYKRVLKYPKSGVYNYALYKLGWVYFNQARFPRALETFFDVVEKTRGNKKLETINRAAKKDFVRVYAEVGYPRKAYLTFKRLDKGYAFKMLQILGDIYLDQGAAKKAIYTFRELIRIEPRHEKVCEWQYSVFQGMLTVGNKKQKVDELVRLVRLFQVYRDKKLLKGSYLSECRDNAKETTGELAKVWHNEAIKTLNTDTLAYVENLYKIYIEVFQDASDVGDMQFYYAELLWARAEAEKNARIQTELWEQVALAFTDVVKSKKLSAKLVKEAAYAAVLGWKNALAVDPRTNVKASEKTGEKSKKIVAQKIPERESKMIEAFDIYINYVKDPKDDELVVIKFLKARIYWRYGQYDKAVPIFDDILIKHRDRDEALFAANIALNILYEQRNFEDLLAMANRLAADKAFLEDKEELAERIRGIQLKAQGDLAQKYKEDGELLKCAEAFRKIYQNNPDSEEAYKVLYNSAVCYEEAHSVGLAIRFFNLLVDKFPDTKEAQRALYRLGYNFGAIARYKQAAAYYEKFANKYGGEKLAPDALGDAVFYRRGIGDDSQAIKNTESFIKKYRKKKGFKEKTAEALFSIGLIYERQDDKDKLASHLHRYLREMGRQGGKDRVIQAHSRIGQIYWEKSCPVKSINGACVKISRSKSYVSRRKKRRRSSNLPTQCGPDSKIKLRVVERDRSLVKKARKQFKSAISVFAKGRGVNGLSNVQKIRGGRYASAAHFYLAEADYEGFLAIKFPSKLNFDPRKKKRMKASKKKFKTWLDTKQKSAAQVQAQYMSLVKKMVPGGASYAISGAARVGQIMQNFADSLYTAKVPKNVRSGPYAEDATFAYCDALTEAAEPLEKKSVNAFSFCLNSTTNLNWFNEWSQLCEKELGQIRPQDFPPAAEIHSQPIEVGAITDISPVITTLENGGK